MLIRADNYAPVRSQLNRTAGHCPCVSPGHRPRQTVVFLVMYTNRNHCSNGSDVCVNVLAKALNREPKLSVRPLALQSPPAPLAPGAPDSFASLAAYHQAYTHTTRVDQHTNILCIYSSLQLRVTMCTHAYICMDRHMFI